MSSTNHTANYNLPQFVGTDKPAWLGDINPAMSTIDSRMKANADGVAGILDMFNLTQVSSKNANTLISIAGLSVSGSLRLAQNADGSIFKFYNFITITNTTENSINVPLTSVPGLTGVYAIKVLQLNQAPTEAYVINCAGTTVFKENDGSTLQNVGTGYLYVGTDGYVYMMGGESSTWTMHAHQQITFYFHPCVYFNTTFGDN